MQTMKNCLRMYRRLALVAVSLVFVAVAPGLVHSQGDIEFLADPAFENPQRPPAVFHHDEHNANAALEDQCWYCHHMDGSNPSPDEDSIGIPCSDCHAVDADDGSTSLLMAYHIQCQRCHTKEKKGPITCGECHVR
ncbi:acidic tetraheme cytochrome c3 TmcA [Oceanidesulfovibrio marinus]|nr:cytochrome c3 family protein [Oceanidesulfovibrio marinus]